ncbi:MAG TPA: response regulator transcription factor, partial [Stenomitos sp.]
IEVIHTTSEGNNWIDPSIARLVLQHAQQEAQTHKMLSRTDNNTEHLNVQADSSRNGSVLIQGIDSDHEKLLSNDPLTERELEILHLIVQGCSNAAISERLYITVGTVKTHVRNILNKLSADDRTEAAVLALRSGLVL